MQEARKAGNHAGHDDVRVTVTVRGDVWGGIGVALLLNLRDGDVEPRVLVEAMRPGAVAHHGQEEVARGPDLVFEIRAYGGRNRGRGQEIVNVVSCPFRLQLCELVWDLDPGVAAKVFIPVHADDVPTVLEVEVNHALDAPEACANDQDGVFVLRHLPMERPHAADVDQTGDLIRQPLRDSPEGGLLLDGEAAGVCRQEVGEEVLDLADGGAHLGADGHAVLRALDVDLHGAIGKTLLPVC
mmetsp:Transcript_36208/g.108255  ORF Transcript_36208/g.108255 Transcript_36208/m.108255 type:complete len:241 (-) Transcript_36208:212-934(-)